MATPTLAANCTWFTQGGTTVKRASITKITIVDSYTPTGSEKSSWDASAAKNGSVMAYINGSELTISGNGTGNVYANPDSRFVFSDKNLKDLFSNVTSIYGLEKLNMSTATTAADMFDSCSSLQTISDISRWDMSNVTDTQYMFWGCQSVSELNIADWDISSVTTTKRMFFACTSLEDLNLSDWNIGNVEDMMAMFMSSDAKGTMKLSSIGDVSGWDTSKVATMQAMFANCPLLKTLDVGNWDVSSCESMLEMFRYCTSLEKLDVTSWDTGACKDMRSMFYGCTSLAELDVTSWDTGACKDMSFMFYGCTSLAELDVSEWNVSNVTSMKGVFSCGNDYGKTPMIIKELDVSNWDTSSCTDVSFMFYGCTKQKTLDMSKWDVSKVTTFDHMFAHSGINVGDISHWSPGAACTNMNAMFWGVNNTVLDVSKFDTSNVQFFCQMFENASNLTEIIGLENFDTSNGLGFDEMFKGCGRLQRLNLSSFDTRKAKDNVTASENGHKTLTLRHMFNGMSSLERIDFGPNFSFKGDGTTTNIERYAVLPTPDASYITDADGNWYDIDKTAYAPDSVPDGTGTYFASASIADEADNKLVLVKQGTLLRTAMAIRDAKGASARYFPAEFPGAIREVGT